MSDLATGIILGVVEGITEYLPVSSTGHLIVAGHLLGFAGEKADTFEIFIQLGAIMAVIWLYLSRLSGILAGVKSRKTGTFNSIEGVVKLGIATVPALVFGFFLHHYIKEHLFSTTVVACSLIVGGIVLLIFPDEGDQPVSSLDTVSYSQSLGMGLFQVLALCPGVSRSGATIIGGMVLGCRRSIAAEFSFLLAIPTMCAAVGYDFLKSLHALSTADIPLFAVGFIVSYIVALMTVKAFVAFLNESTLKVFGVYRICFGIIVYWYFNY